MVKIYKHSHFLPEAFGHGGNKRTSQINELLQTAEIGFCEAELINVLASGSRFQFYLKGLRYNFNTATGNKTKYAIGRYLTLFENFIKETAPGLFIWESTVGYNLLLAEILYKYNIPVIGMPHNIESLVTGSVSVFSNRVSPAWLFEEIKYLNYCKKVFTISREESWLLSTAGIEADSLPYYPTKDVEQYLLDIRQRKLKRPQRTGQKKILLLGTFYNQPTTAGYTDLLLNIGDYKDIQIDVAGFGSEHLKGLFNKKSINIHGSVSKEELAHLITGADMGIIHQQPSSGALTRISELLIAGLPLLLNTHAARNCAGMHGTIIYRSYTELLTALREDIPEMPPVLQRPPEEKIFVEYIKSLVG